MSYSAASWKRHYCNNIHFYYLVTDFFCNKGIKVIEIAFIEIVIAFNFGHKYDLMKKVNLWRVRANLNFRILQHLVYSPASNNSLLRTEPTCSHNLCGNWELPTPPTH